MKTYTYTEARQQLAGLLDEASRKGEVRIRRRDGQLYVLQPIRPTRSPLDVPGVKTDITLGEILEFIREGREAGLPNKRLQPAKARRRSPAQPKVKKPPRSRS